MIKTIEIAPYIYVDTLVKVVMDQLHESIILEGGDTWGVYIYVDESSLREAFLKVLLARSG